MHVCVCDSQICKFQSFANVQIKRNKAFSSIKFSIDMALRLHLNKLCFVKNYFDRSYATMTISSAPKLGHSTFLRHIHEPNQTKPNRIIKW